VAIALTLAAIAVDAVGIFFGFFYIGSNTPLAITIVTATTVGIVGVLAFLRHVVFHKQDMAMIGWETDRPDWMFEVGFANLGFGLAALIAMAAGMGTKAQATVLLGYAIYLFQASVLHGYRYFTDAKKDPMRLWRSCLLTMLVAGLMTYFAIAGMLA
jgi:hypothetical protein